MTTEERLIEAFAAAGAYEPSRDLWRRTLHSIEADRRYRRNKIITAVWVGVCVATLGLAAAATTEGTGASLRFDWRALEVAELVILAVVAATLASSIRRFGRGYVEEHFRANPVTGTRLMHLFEIAFFLLSAGYVLSTTRLAAPDTYWQFEGLQQIKEVAVRVGGLMLILGILHTVTLMSMPLIGLVYNATRMHTRLPRWVTAVLVLAGVVTSMMLLVVLGGLPTIGRG